MAVGRFSSCASCRSSGVQLVQPPWAQAESAGPQEAGAEFWQGTLEAGDRVAPPGFLLPTPGPRGPGCIHCPLSSGPWWFTHLPPYPRPLDWVQGSCPALPLRACDFASVFSSTGWGEQNLVTRLCGNQVCRAHLAGVQVPPSSLGRQSQPRMAGEPCRSRDPRLAHPDPWCQATAWPWTSPALRRLSFPIVRWGSGPPDRGGWARRWGREGRGKLPGPLWDWVTSAPTLLSHPSHQRTHHKRPGGSTPTRGRCPSPRSTRASHPCLGSWGAGRSSVRGGVGGMGTSSWVGLLTPPPQAASGCDPWGSPPGQRGVDPGPGPPLTVLTGSRRGGPGRAGPRRPRSPRAAPGRGGRSSRPGS